MFTRFNSLRGWIQGAAGMMLLAAPVWGQQTSSCTGLHPNCAGCQAFLKDCAPGAMSSPPAPEAESAEVTDGSLPAVEPENAPIPDLPPVTPTPNANNNVANANRPSSSDLAGFSSNMGAAQGYGGVPSMIGDFFAGGFQYGPAFNNATASPAGADRRFKFSDNNSPFPQNRLFFNYNHFHNATVDINGQDQNLNRYTFGLERLIGNGLSSWEVRIPFAGTVSADQVVGNNDTTATEFGNIAFALKRLLYRSSYFNLSGGLGIVLPTGRDSNFFNASNSLAPSVTFSNDAVHLQPFLGVYIPRGRSFHQFFTQLDFDANGNDVTFSGRTEKLQDQTLLFLDYSYGYWLFQNRSNALIQSLAPMVELHYITTTQDQDYGQFDGLFTIDPRRDVLNLTGGLYMQFSPLAALKVGAVSPLRTIGSDKPFDTELGLQFIRRY